MRKRTWKHSTFWITTWAILTLTGIVVRTLGDTSMSPSAAGILQVVSGLCGTIVLAYVGGNKAIDFRHGPEQEKEHDQ
jgi:energy-converting hydrogenase Eha subunit A